MKPAVQLGSALLGSPRGAKPNSERAPITITIIIVCPVRPSARLPGRGRPSSVISHYARVVCDDDGDDGVTENGVE